MKEIKSDFQNVGNPNIYIVVAEFNSIITNSLLSGAVACLNEFGITNITTVHVPGAFEQPLMASIIAKEKNPDGIICLGAVIKGSTAHFDFVAGQNASGLMQVMRECNIPVMNGVLTCDSVEQAFDRAGAKMGNKGYECAVGLIKMLSVISQVKKA